MMDSYRREVNEFYSDENSVNLREFQRDQQNPNPNNLDLCDDDLFDDLFPATAEIDHCKDSDSDYRLVEVPSSKQGNGHANRAAILTEHLSNLQQQDDQTNSTSDDSGENSVIKRHVLYLMDQLPHSSTQNPYPMKIVPKQERTESSDSNTDQHSNSEKSQPPQSPTDSDHIPSPERHQSSSSSHSSSNEAPFTPSMSVGTKELVTNMIKAEPVDIEELTKKRSRRGRKRKTTESENELTRAYNRENNEYKKKRLRNNIAVRKSRDKAKHRQMEVQKKLIALADENKGQKTMIEKIKCDYDTMEGRFEELNKRLEETLKMNVRMRQFISTLPLEFQPQFSL